MADAKTPTPEQMKQRCGDVECCGSEKPSDGWSDEAIDALWQETWDSGVVGVKFRSGMQAEIRRHFARACARRAFEEAAQIIEDEASVTEGMTCSERANVAAIRARSRELEGGDGTR